MEKISYERRAYKSVDDKSISKALRKLTGKRSWAVKG